MAEPELLKLNIHQDERGNIRFCNEFDLTPYQRFYQISAGSAGEERQIRAWQGHKIERKVFLPIYGKVKIVLIEVLDFSKPEAGKILEYILDSSNPELLVVPGGFANGIQFLEIGSTIMVFSDLTLQDSKADDFRFKEDLFYNW